MLCPFFQRLIDHFCPSVRLVPTLGKIVEQRGPVVPTPQFRSPCPRYRRYLLMSFQMTDSEEIDLTINALDKKGNPAPLESINWSTDNTDVLALKVSDDTKTCVVKAVGPLGKATVTMKADADMSPDIDAPIIGTIEIEITGGQAQTVELVPSAPREQS